jgi:hypothetical protein
MPSLLPLGDVKPAGDLRRRAALNFQRLNDPAFRFEAMMTSNTAREAPGDWVGRSILGLSLLGQVLGTEPPYLEAIVARLPSALNARGYLGPIHPAGTADENQVGGHNGLMRGLCEYVLWKNDNRAREILQSVIRELMLPTRPLYAEYPDHKLAQLGAGRPIGLTVKNEGVWLGLSTDIGTVFFALDGLTQAYVLEPSTALRTLIETMIARVMQLDVRAIGAQTHSMLSTLRGILRWWEIVDRRPELLSLVRERYALYRAVAETEHYANYNWFDRPEWTEACAVVDSFLLAVELWRATQDSAYLATAHHVYFNALSYAQRPNGGFGCDVCVGAGGVLHVSPHPKIFEAPWCCSMRGAEGLARAAQAGTLIDEPTRTVWQVFYFEGEVTLRFGAESATVRCTSSYPFDGHVSWIVEQSSLREEIEWRCFVPPGVGDDRLRLSHRGTAVPVRAHAGFVGARLALQEGDAIELTFPIHVRAEQPGSPQALNGHHRFAHGPLLLAAEQSTISALAADEAWSALGRARYRCERTGLVLEPINDLTYRSEAEARRHRAQLIFPDLLH